MPRSGITGSYGGFIPSFFFLTLQYCIGFAIYQHESTTGIHVFPILNPPSHLPPRIIPLGHASAPAPSFKGISILSSIVAVSIYIPTNNARVFPFLHTLSRICSL